MRRFFISVQEIAGEWISLGTTKTGIVYRLKDNRTQSRTGVWSFNLNKIKRASWKRSNRSIGSFFWIGQYFLSTSSDPDFLTNGSNVQPRGRIVLALRSNLTHQLRIVEEGTWQRSTIGSLLRTDPSEDLCGATMGIIGFGNIAKRVATIAHAFGMDVLVAERKGSSTVRSGRVEFPLALKRSDILSLHCLLNSETRGMIGAAELHTMKPQAILINCARGELIDNAALATALASGVIAGAGLDGLETEPPSAANPLLNLRHANLIITPHVAWASQRAIEQFRLQLVDNMEAFARGAPRNAVS